LDYPNEERELAILKLDFPDLLDALGTQALTFVRRVRLLRLKKHPSISEVLDWVRILDESGITHLSEESVTETLNILLKHQQDCIQVTQVMKQEHWLDGNDRT
jgi:MoxR-like ATPase